jgi:hypothetical protein
VSARGGMPLRPDRKWRRVRERRSLMEPARRSCSAPRNTTEPVLKTCDDIASRIVKAAAGRLDTRDFHWHSSELIIVRRALFKGMPNAYFRPIGRQ